MPQLRQHHCTHLSCHNGETQRAMTRLCDMVHFGKLTPVQIVSVVRYRLAGCIIMQETKKTT